MKKLLLFLISTNFLFANYNLYYHDIKVGEMENLNNLKEGYIKAKPTHTIVKLLTGFKENFIYYKKNSKPDLEDTYFEKDKNNYLDILYTVLNEKPKFLIKNIKETKDLKVECNNNRCEWEYIDVKSKKIKYKGFMILDKDNKLEKFVHISKNIKILNNNNF